MTLTSDKTATREAWPVHAGAGTRAAVDSGSGDRVCHRVADALALAATPTFALMAWLTRAPGGGSMDMSDPVAQHAAALSGMAVMYGLMGFFHAGPWLRLLARRRQRGGRS